MNDDDEPKKKDNKPETTVNDVEKLPYELDDQPGDWDVLDDVNQEPAIAQAVQDRPNKNRIESEPQG